MSGELNRLDSLPDLTPKSLYRPHLRPLDLASDVSQSPSPRRTTNHVLLTPPLTPSSSFSSQNTPSTPSDSTSSIHQDYYDIPEPESSRLLLVGNVPAHASSTTLQQYFKPCGSIKGILVRFQSQHGIVVIAFYDSRDAYRAKSYISAIVIDGALLTAKLVSSTNLRKLAPGPNTFIDECEGKIEVTLDEGAMPPNDIRDLLTSFGQLQSFQALAKSCYAEYFDCRCAQAAVENLHSLMASGADLRVVIVYDVDDGSRTRSDSEANPPSQFPTPVIKASDFESAKAHVRSLFSGPSGRLRPRSVSAGESAKPTNVHELSESSSLEHNRNGSNTLLFDAVGKPQIEDHDEDASGRGCAGASDISFNNPAITTYPYDYSHSHPQQVHQSYPQLPSPIHTFAHYDDAAPIAYHHPAYPAYHYSYAPENPYIYANLSNWEYSTPIIPHIPHHAALHSPEYFVPSPLIDASVSPPFSPISPSPISPAASSKSFGPRLQNSPSILHTRTSGTAPPPPPPERNLLNTSKIEDGLDTRTTVMIKNIPNKMSDKDLLAFINKVCPRRIDFLYLRMDFQNGCNVGYAFVNFITVQDLLVFARAKLGVKWNLYSSEKVLQMSYANYQGKEALIEKFKNSCIMDERESYRPKIFYSSGAKEGLSEPFPAPTHLRRKERSSNNRGPLFVGNGGGLKPVTA